MEQLVSRYPEFDAFLIDMAVGLRSSADQLRPDDLLDAACLAVTAALAADGMCETIPVEPEQDENGLYMKLTIPKKIIGVPGSGQKVAVVTG